MRVSLPETWTIRTVLQWTRAYFEQCNVDAPRLTAELLLAHLLKVERVQLYIDFERPLTKAELKAYRELIQRRRSGEPTQYLVGTKEFYGRRFTVNAQVMIPRPETELLVEASLRAIPEDASTHVLDLCTGAGCIAVSIAAERPQASIVATDLAIGALEVAKMNAAHFKVEAQIIFYQGDLFEPLPTDARYDVIVSNPPYVQRDVMSTLPKEVQREPQRAFDGGRDGIDIIRKIISTAKAFLKPGGMLALEMGDEQGEVVRKLLLQTGYRHVHIEQDWAHCDRFAFCLAAQDS